MLGSGFVHLALIGTVVLTLLIQFGETVCTFNPARVLPCSTSCDWSDPQNWIDCGDSFPKDGVGAVIDTPGDYTLYIDEDFEWGNLTIGGDHSDSVQTVLINATQHMQLSGYTSVLDGGNLEVNMASLPIGGIAPEIKDGGLLTFSSGAIVNFGNAIANDGTIMVLPHSSFVQFVCNITGTGIFLTESGGNVMFDDVNIELEVFSSMGTVSGPFSFTGQEFISGGTLGAAAGNITIHAPLTLTNGSDLRINAVSDDVYTAVRATDVIIEPMTTLSFFFDRLFEPSDTKLTFLGVSSARPINGNFGDVMYLYDDDFYNVFNCTPKLVDQTTKMELHFENCLVAPEPSSSDFFGYDKQTLTYVGISLAVGIVLIVIIALLLRVWRNRRVSTAAKRDFYNLKEEEFYSEELDETKEKGKKNKKEVELRTNSSSDLKSSSSRDLTGSADRSAAIKEAQDSFSRELRSSSSNSELKASKSDSLKGSKSDSLKGSKADLKGSKSDLKGSKK